MNSTVDNAQIRIDGYNAVRHDRTVESRKQLGGGILVYYHTSWTNNHHIIAQLCLPDIEIISILFRPFRLAREIPAIIIMATYIPPSAKRSPCLSHIDDQLSLVHKKYPHALIFLLGDMNHVTPNLPTFSQIVKTPTREQTILDRCYINIKNIYRAKTLPPLNRSDHKMVHIIPTHKPAIIQKTRRTITKRIWSPEAIDNIGSQLASTDWTIFNTKDLEKDVEAFNAYLTFCMDTHAPNVTRQIPNNSKPWITPNTIALIKEKLVAYRGNDKHKVRKLEHQIRHQMKENKRLYMKEIETNFGKQPKVSWHGIKNIFSLNKSQNTKLIDGLNEVQTVNRLNTHFTRFERPVDGPTIVSVPDEHALTVDPVDVLKQLRNINTNKGTGPDGLPPRFLKEFAIELHQILTGFYNRSLSTGKTPTIWKTSRIAAIPKKNNDYRPIAITSCVAKILERILKPFLSKHLDKDQYAYQKGKGTQHALLKLTDTITKHLNQHRDNYARGLFLDYSSAFNTIEISTLAKRLSDLNPIIQRWIISFLTNRTQYTQIGNTTSNHMTTNTGTPQGTVLSPLIFCLYTKELQTTHDDLTIIKFADDTVLLGLFEENNDTSTTEKYMSEIARIKCWSDNSKLLLNAQKTAEIIFTTKPNQPVVKPVTINGETITHTSQTTYLGVSINNRLNWDPYMDKIIHTAEKHLFLLRKSYKLLASPKMIATLYKSYVQCHLLYFTPIILEYLKAKHLKAIHKLDKIASTMTKMSFNTRELMTQQRKLFLYKILADDEHYFNHLDRLPSGRFRTEKWRILLLKRSFRCHFIHFTNSL